MKLKLFSVIKKILSELETDIINLNYTDEKNFPPPEKLLFS